MVRIVAPAGVSARPPGAVARGARWAVGAPAGRALRAVQAALAALAALACSDPPVHAARAAVTGDAGATPDVPVVVAAVERPSQRLGCGGPCDAPGLGTAVSAEGDCAEGVARRCVDGVVSCEECPADGRECVVSPARCERAGAGEEVCLSTGECYERVCVPNTRWCDGGVLVQCDDAGRAEHREPCQEGLDCLSGQCLPAQPYVLILFDTSGSMNAEVRGPLELSKAVFPACEDAEDPKTALGVSKKAFALLFNDPRYDNVMFSLIRFPQVLLADVKPACFSGSWVAQNTITGHTGVYGSGPWFDAGLREVLLEPFPAAGQKGNRQALARWLDFDEVERVEETPCSSDHECPGGVCTSPGGQGRCRYSDNPELRAALAATPLGTTLYYAGEYLRKFVVTEGQACLLDRDCLTPHQTCEAGKCHDPNRFCRQRSIVAFTDGYDNATFQAFHEPVVQAKRLRGGLDCSSDADCSAAFRCDAGSCQRRTGGCGAELPCPTERRPFPAATEVGANRLFDANGDPIDITVHVVEVGGIGDPAGANAAMAMYGGGLYVNPSLADPDTLYQGIRGVIDWKAADFCASE